LELQWFIRIDPFNETDADLRSNTFILESPKKTLGAILLQEKCGFGLDAILVNVAKSGIYY
jgi:hypothetical protein